MNTTTAPESAVDPRRFKSFAEFYPFYLTEHANRTCRRLHFIGSTISLLCLVALIVTLNPLWLLAALVAGYGFAWVGHFGFEKNRPASFKRPLYSFDVPRHLARQGQYLIGYQINSTSPRRSECSGPFCHRSSSGSARGINNSLSSGSMGVDGSASST
jgi:hypothetical protein